MPQILSEEDPDFRIGYGWTVESLKRGVYLSPYHNMFLSSAHTEKNIAQTLDATDEAFAAVRKKQSTLKVHPVVEQLLESH